MVILQYEMGKYHEVYRIATWWSLRGKDQQ